MGLSLWLWWFSHYFVSNSCDSMNHQLPGMNTEMGCRFLLQGFFTTKRLNLDLLHVGRFFTAAPPGKHNTEIKTIIDCTWKEYIHRSVFPASWEW